jgi:Zn-dependent protease with chaperone function
MFTNVFFVILLILLIGFIPVLEIPPGATVSDEPFIQGLIVFGVLLCIIIVQNRLFKKTTRLHQPRMLLLTNFELLGFLSYFYFILYAHQSFPQSEAFNAIVSTIFYFIGLGVHHLSTYSLQRHAIREEYPSPLSYAWMQIAFIIPFILPFIVLSFIIDFSSWLPAHYIILISLVSILGILILFPVALRYFWNCKTIEDEALRHRFDNFCKRLHFKHAGIIRWSVMKHALTAGIIGIVPRFRYIMFTDRILRELPPEPLEAILAHEIAHSKLKHLIYYPLIILGMSIVGIFAFELLGDSITSPFAAYFIYAVIAVLYFRFVFGYFSRIFERQADLYVFAAGVPHNYMLQALDYIGVAAGNIHLVPSWHHYGIQERIHFLCDAAIDRKLIEKHNRKVKWSLVAYFTIFFLSIIILIGVIYEQS